MKYYKIDYISIFNTKEEVLGYANGEFVHNGKEYFEKIGNGEIIKEAPVFNYFYLQTSGAKKEWEWRLQDVHGGAYEYPAGGYWYISDDFKLLLENFKIAPDYHFYETKLLYKGNKLKYWIFQSPINPFQNMDFQKCEFIIKDNINTYIFHSKEEYLLFYKKHYRETKTKLRSKIIFFNEYYDYVVNANTGDKLVSENLKNAIETLKLEGLEFFEIDYEVSVANS
ncbi:hypothetical protein HNP99_002816 [Flavobacterium sp. 28A]|uniref:hypothetical protein n=1 Tax=Flavobacterium sp. 28A TaxID=2735895 RepID=UPI001571456A|nr:hypothetical protein [Flavobacterium sp. 28A]NRT16449.1 hypothetical protein [Flavobacterium sp. 28A]